MRAPNEVASFDDVRNFGEALAARGYDAGMGAAPQYQYNPYQPPHQPAPGGGQYRPLGVMTTLVQIGVVSTAVLGLGAALGTGAMKGMADPPEAPADLMVVAAVALVGLGSLACTLVTAILFLVWLHGAAKNARAVRSFMAHSPGWCVGCWFVPFMSLIVPYQAVSEIYRASDPDTAGDEAAGWAGRPVPAIFPIWWVTFLLHSFVGTFAALAKSEGGAGAVVGALFYIVSGIMLVMIVRRIADRQTASAQKLSLWR